MTTPPQKPHVMRSLGQFFGHILSGIRHDTSKPAPTSSSSTRHVVNHQVHEETRETPAGKVLLRRTTIEEVELPPGSTSPSSAPPGNSPSP